MGLYGISNSSFDPEHSEGEKHEARNPDPGKYSIKKMHKKDDFLILKINYPDYTNCEGNKILVFKGCTIVELVQQGAIDPHFSEDKNHISPIARFKPDAEGWNMAEFFVENFK